MSERAEVMVEMPVTHLPVGQEARDLLKQAFTEAKKLVGPGRVLGIVSRGVAISPETGQPVVLVRFAVEAPESLQPQRTLIVPT